MRYWVLCVAALACVAAAPPPVFIPSPRPGSSSPPPVVNELDPTLLAAPLSLNTVDFEITPTGAWMVKVGGGLWNPEMAPLYRYIQDNYKGREIVRVFWEAPNGRTLKILSRPRGWKP